MLGANSLLIVEDDLLTAELYQILLEKAGYNVVLANSASEANEVLDGIEVHAVVLDYDLPDSNGLNWLRRLRDYPEFFELPVPQQIVTVVESTLALFTEGL